MQAATITAILPGLVFIPAVRSPNKRPLLILSNEVSGTTGVFEVELR